jgi:hypothetical protein
VWKGKKRKGRWQTRSCAELSRSTHKS